MKKLLLLATAAVLLTATGCKKVCDDWHEGKKCETEIREKYYGNYYGTFQTTSGNQNSNALVQEYPGDASKIKIGLITAQITTKDVFTIPSQTQSVNGQIVSVSGSGYFEGNTLRFSLNGSGGLIVFVGYR